MERAAGAGSAESIAGSSLSGWMVRKVAQVTSDTKALGDLLTGPAAFEEGRLA